jgi:hypothetical protein
MRPRAHALRPPAGPPWQLLAWQRVRVASAMAATGREWFEAFRTAASGTYVNQCAARLPATGVAPRRTLVLLEY